MEGFSEYEENNTKPSKKEIMEDVSELEAEYRMLHTKHTIDEKIRDRLDKKIKQMHRILESPDLVEFDYDESVVDMKNVEEATEEPKIFQCDVCNFETTNKAKFDKHKFEKHSVQGKWVCCGCKWEFATRKEFNSHKYHGCSL